MKENTKKIDLVKKVYSKTEYPKIINTKFQQLGVVSVNEQIEATPNCWNLVFIILGYSVLEYTFLTKSIFFVFSFIMFFNH